MPAPFNGTFYQMPEQNMLSNSVFPPHPPEIQDFPESYKQPPPPPSFPNGAAWAGVAGSLNPEIDCDNWWPEHRPQLSPSLQIKKIVNDGSYVPLYFSWKFSLTLCFLITLYGKDHNEFLRKHHLRYEASLNQDKILIRIRNRRSVLRNRSRNRNRRNRIILTQEEPEPEPYPCSRFRLQLRFRFLLQKKISN